MKGKRERDRKKRKYQSPIVSILCEKWKCNIIVINCFQTSVVQVDCNFSIYFVCVVLGFSTVMLLTFDIVSHIIFSCEGRPVHCRMFAAAKSLQLCSTLCDPINGVPQFL